MLSFWLLPLYHGTTRVACIVLYTYAVSTPLRTLDCGLVTIPFYPVGFSPALDTSFTYLQYRLVFLILWYLSLKGSYGSLWVCEVRPFFHLPGSFHGSSWFGLVCVSSFFSGASFWLALVFTTGFTDLPNFALVDLLHLSNFL